MPDRLASLYLPISLHVFLLTAYLSQAVLSLTYRLTARFRDGLTLSAFVDLALRLSFAAFFFSVHFASVAVSLFASRPVHSLSLDICKIDRTYRRHVALVTSAEICIAAEQNPGHSKVPAARSPVQRRRMRAVLEVDLRRERTNQE